MNGESKNKTTETGMNEAYLKDRKYADVQSVHKSIEGHDTRKDIKFKALGSRS